MIYTYDYSFLLNKISERYKQESDIKNILKFSQETHINFYRLKNILIEQKDKFNTDDIINISNIFNFNREHIVRAFLKYKDAKKTKFFKN